MHIAAENNAFDLALELIARGTGLNPRNKVSITFKSSPSTTFETFANSMGKYYRSSRRHFITRPS